MNMVDLRGRKVAVLGAAKSGVSASNLLLELGAIPLLSDTAGEDELAEHLAKLRSGVQVTTGRNELGDAELVVVSPGISPNAPILKEARRQGCRIWSEIELAFNACRAPIAAVTGTDGKTTTTSLLGQICDDAGIPTFVGGNIGRPLSEGVLSVPEHGVVVAEVSCFQLLNIERFRPRVGLLLNIAQDHLDYHASFEEYVSAKKRVFLNAGPGDTAVLNADDTATAGMASILRSRPVMFSSRQRVHGGVYSSDGDLVAEGLPGGPHHLCSRRELALPGNHNVENALAAAAGAIALGVAPARISETLRAFKGLPHRIETIGWVGDVRFINDTKATNPHAAIAGLRCFDEPVVLIAGGVDKGLDLDELAEEARRRCTSVVLIGQIRERMADVFRAKAVPMVHLAASMEEAVALATRLAPPKSVVLLSPACSSFDMFASYGHRGQVFSHIVSNMDNFKEKP